MESDFLAVGTEKVKAKEDQSYAQSAQTVTVSNQGLYSIKLAFAKKMTKNFENSFSLILLAFFLHKTGLFSREK